MDLLARHFFLESLACEPKVQRVCVVLSFAVKVPLEELDPIRVLKEHVEGMCPSKTRWWWGVVAAAGCATAVGSEIGLLLLEAQGWRVVDVGVWSSTAWDATLWQWVVGVRGRVWFLKRKIKNQYEIKKEPIVALHTSGKKLNWPMTNHLTFIEISILQKWEN